MSTYSYKLHKNNKTDKTAKTRYKEKELRLMTTYQLREICNKEKIVKSIINPLDKEELIRLIMRYKGVVDSLFIESQSEDGLERLQRFLRNVDKSLLNENEIQAPAKIVVYNSIGLEIFDNYRVNVRKNFEESNVVLVDNNFKVCTIFNLVSIKEGQEEKYYLVKNKSIDAKESESKHYSLLFFEKKESELLYDIYYGKEELEPSYIRCYSLPILQFEIKEICDTNMPLAIDFGTSNTTAGVYINKESFFLLNENDNRNEIKENDINFVKVIESKNKDIEITPLIPSIVGVKAISDDKIEYLFGYDAIKASKISYIDEGLSIFYDIKRWINDYERMEKVIDATNKRTFIKRKDIIKAYLEYIIELAKQRFKCNFKYIHISSPMKQKKKFHLLFKEILTDYIIQSENTLEEGAAVLFNTISELIESNRYIEGEKYSALIIDCGGGTTDLSSCNFTIRNNRVSYKIDIETAYENGDTDFGGNNLTFRILQLIKILFADKILNGYTDIKANIIDEFDVDVFRYVDTNGPLKIYEKLNREYEKAERIIPTKFKEYEDKSKEDYYKVKSNYYLLFDLAEELKKEFFENPSLLNLNLTTEPSKGEEEDTIVFDKWKLSYIKNDRFEKLVDKLELKLNVYEVSVLLKADIYSIIKRFLEKLYEDDRLFNFSTIKLTGQSCKVEIFKEALKEFIPGKMIQFRKNKKDEKKKYDLKLSCLRGSLKYLQAQKFGHANINLHTKTPTLPYIITAYTHTGEEKVLIEMNKRITMGTISRFMERIVLKLYLKDTNGFTKYEYDYEVNIEDFKPTLAEEIENMYYGVINQHDTDNIVNDEVKFFVYPIEEEWGFSVVPILRQEEKLLIGKEAFFSYENDQWETNYFDGLK
ncbi:MAG: molecular chaperone [Clostridiaceae bacterium]